MTFRLDRPALAEAKREVECDVQSSALALPNNAAIVSRAVEGGEDSHYGRVSRAGRALV